MLDIRVLREQMATLRDALARRGALDALKPVLDRAEQLERDRRTLIQAAAGVSSVSRFRPSRKSSPMPKRHSRAS
jgi:hypothetical protein